jgi:hypothetical protein
MHSMMAYPVDCYLKHNNNLLQVLKNSVSLNYKNLDLFKRVSYESHTNCYLFIHEYYRYLREV